MGAHKAEFRIRKFNTVQVIQKKKNCLQVRDLFLKGFRDTMEQYFLPCWGCSAVL